MKDYSPLFLVCAPQTLLGTIWNEHVKGNLNIHLSSLNVLKERKLSSHTVWMYAHEYCVRGLQESVSLVHN